MYICEVGCVCELAWEAHAATTDSSQSDAQENNIFCELTIKTSINMCVLPGQEGYSLSLSKVSIFQIFQFTLYSAMLQNLFWNAASAKYSMSSVLRPDHASCTEILCFDQPDSFCAVKLGFLFSLPWWRCVVLWRHNVRTVCLQEFHDFRSNVKHLYSIYMELSTITRYMWLSTWHCGAGWGLESGIVRVKYQVLVFINKGPGSYL